MPVLCFCSSKLLLLKNYHTASKHYKPTCLQGSEMIDDQDALCAADFDVNAYINKHFPTEQSLSKLDSYIEKIETEIVAANRYYYSHYIDLVGSGS